MKFIVKMASFLFSPTAFDRMVPKANCVKLIMVKEKMLYYTDLQTTNYFIIKTYDYKKLIFYITHEDDMHRAKRLLGHLAPIDTHILVDNTMDKQQVLYELEADIHFNRRVYFIHRKEFAHELSNAMHLEPELDVF